MSSGKRRKIPPARAVTALLLAVTLHGAAGGLIRALPPWDRQARPLALTPADEGPDEAPLEITALPDRAEQAERLRELDRPQQLTPEEERRKKEEEKTRAEGQVVDIPRPVLEQRPDEARYLAEYDSLVKKETRGPRGQGQGGAREAATPMPPVPVTQPGRPGPPGPLAKTAGREAPPGPMAMRAPTTPARNDLQPSRFGPDGTIGPPGERAPAPAPHEPSRPASPGGGLPRLTATPQQLERALGIGAPGSLDALQDLDEGETTSLSAKKWKFAVFFNRLKRAVAAEWHPDTVYLRHDPSGNIYGVKDRVTVLRVHLNPDGEIANLELLRPSGVDFLDDEAQGAFKRAQPFLNPPPQLVEADGQIHFNFAFIFELSGKASFKVFRY